MFVYKKKYYLLIENTRDLDLSNINFSNKFVIIYRNNTKVENLSKLIKFRQNCKIKRIDFYVSNNVKLMKSIKADGLYISSYNRDLSLLKLKYTQYKLIGSAHNLTEIQQKTLQGCTHILVSRLFKTVYRDKKDFLGTIKFNLLKRKKNANLVPLGGIRLTNLNKLKIVRSESFALMSEVKKMPAKIISRLL